MLVEQQREVRHQPPSRHHWDRRAGSTTLVYLDAAGHLSWWSPPPLRRAVPADVGGLCAAPGREQRPYQPDQCPPGTARRRAPGARACRAFFTPSSPVRQLVVVDQSMLIRRKGRFLKNSPSGRHLTGSSSPHDRWRAAQSGADVLPDAVITMCRQKNAESVVRTAGTVILAQFQPQMNRDRCIHRRRSTEACRRRASRHQANSAALADAPHRAPRCDPGALPQINASRTAFGAPGPPEVKPGRWSHRSPP